MQVGDRSGLLECEGLSNPDKASVDSKKPDDLSAVARMKHEKRSVSEGRIQRNPLINLSNWKTPVQSIHRAAH
jgi:hypothetical protein